MNDNSQYWRHFFEQIWMSSNIKKFYLLHFFAKRYESETINSEVRQWRFLYCAKLQSRCTVSTISSQISNFKVINFFNGLFSCELNSQSCNWFCKKKTRAIIQDLKEHRTRIKYLNKEKKTHFFKCFAICQEHAQRSKIYLRNKTAKTASMRFMPRGVFVTRMRWSE